MPVVSFNKNYPSIMAPDGANLMQTLLDAGLPVASSCSGDGVCAKCKVQIHDGASHLSSPNETEIFLRQTNPLAENERISCQTKIFGDIKVDTNYW